MYAAASGARLAHRHNKINKKQISTNQIDGSQIHYKGYQRHPQIRYSDIHGNRYPGTPSKRLVYSSKLYTSNCDPNLKISASYIEINGRISKLGHVDFEAALFLREKQELRKKKLKIRRRRYELPAHVATREIAPFPQFPPNSWGKAAWQDRELSQELERRESIYIPSEVHNSSKLKQKEAHRRWVKRNRIHDLSLGDRSSDEELLYDGQNGAANLLLYVGLGTMCVGMIIAFVGTGEKGFKTMELRLIGPSLIGAGVLIIILRILLCLCPSKCLKLKKHKQRLKNSTNKLNSEGNCASLDQSVSKEPFSEDNESTAKPCDSKKRVSIAKLPISSNLNINLPSSASENFKPPNILTYPETFNQIVVPTVSFLNHEKPSTSKTFNQKVLKNLTMEQETKNTGDAVKDFEMMELDVNQFETNSFRSHNSCERNISEVLETLVSPENSDISITSLINYSPELKIVEENPRKILSASKFELTRNPKNLTVTELVLCPSNLDETKESN